MSEPVDVTSRQRIRMWLTGLLAHFDWEVLSGADRIATTQAKGSYVLVDDLADEVLVIRRRRT